MNPTEYIKNMLLRPGMYVQSVGSLEDVYWALNCIRGTEAQVKILTSAYMKTHYKMTNCPFSFHIKDLNELAVIIREFEKEILKEITP